MSERALKNTVTENRDLTASLPRIPAFLLDYHQVNTGRFTHTYTFIYKQLMHYHTYTITRSRSDEFLQTWQHSWSVYSSFHTWQKSFLPSDKQQQHVSLHNAKSLTVHCWHNKLQSTTSLIKPLSTWLLSSSGWKLHSKKQKKEVQLLLLIYFFGLPVGICQQIKHQTSCQVRSTLTSRLSKRSGYNYNKSINIMYK